MMRTRVSTLLAVLAALVLTGCVMQGMGGGDEASVGNGVQVTAEPGFAQIHIATMRYWTRHGTGLDELHFYTGIKSGQPLFRPAGKRPIDMPVFNARMTPNDIEDLTVASLQKNGFQNVRASALRPCPFGSAQGFCFDLLLANEEGLEMRGRALAATRNQVLDLLVFTAPAEHYYAQLSPAIERIFASITAK
jgi:predicted small secreted protein